MKNRLQVPKWPHTFFKWYCRDDRYEELHGDLEEFFAERVELFGPSKARWLYCLDVLRSCHRHAWSKNIGQNSNLMMYKNYFKTSLRNMMKNPMSSFINISGLSIAIGACLVVYAFLNYDKNIDGFHENKDEVYLITTYLDKEGVLEQNGQTARPLGNMLENDFQQISKMCRIEDRNAVVKHEDKVFREWIRFVDPTFLEMFTFPLRLGTKKTLTDPNAIILSHDMSVKYFGDLDPVGQNLKLILADGASKVFRVGGVAMDFPKAHVIYFDFLINHTNLKLLEPGFDESSWESSVAATFVQIETPEDLTVVKEGMGKYSALQNLKERGWTIAGFEFLSLNGLHHASANVQDGISYDGLAPGRLFLPILGLFMLALACFNYVNMAIVSASKRLREIGMRKVMGANRSKLIVQFLFENMLLTFFAMLLGVILGHSIFMPWMARIAELNLYVDMSALSLWLFFGAIMTITGFVSGLYPSLYVSRFQVVAIFRGAVKFGSRSVLTRVLLGLQLVLACMLITSAVAFAKNTKYQGQRSWGYDQRSVIFTGLPEASAYEKLHATMEANPDVLAISAGSHHIGERIGIRPIQVGDRDFEAKELSVEANYLETMGLVLVAGRGFKTHHESDKFSVLVNETLVKNFGMEDPIGSYIKMDTDRYRVVGVIKDFHHRSFSWEKRPTIFTLADQSDFNFLALKVDPRTRADVLRVLKKQWLTFFPEIPFQGGYQDEVWGGFYSAIQRYENFNVGVGAVAVLIAGLGLYGLVAINISGRRREFCIRKALGATLAHMSKIISRQYLALTMISIVIGTGFGHFFVKSQLDSVFAYPMPVTWSIPLISATLLICVVLLVVLSRVWETMRANPVDGLRAD